MVMSPSKPKDPLKELDNVHLTDNLVDTVRMQTLVQELEEQKAQVARLMAELEKAKTAPVKRKRKQSCIQAVEGLSLAKKYYVLLHLIQALPYQPLTDEDDIDLDSLIPTIPNKELIVNIAHMIDFLNLRKRISNSCPNYFEEYLAELGVTNKAVPVSVEEECPL
jgi:hypothetical protein